MRRLKPTTMIAIIMAMTKHPLDLSILNTYTPPLPKNNRVQGVEHDVGIHCYPLFAPAFNPSTMCFCNTINKTVIGIATSTAPAANIVNSVFCCPFTIS